MDVMPATWANGISVEIMIRMSSAQLESGCWLVLALTRRLVRTLHSHPKNPEADTWAAVSTNLISNCSDVGKHINDRTPTR